ncbi:MAG: hypothetical protein GY861_12165 [bacterium]|nr:hypothetical protein [bacterium]
MAEAEVPTKKALIWGQKVLKFRKANKMSRRVFSKLIPCAPKTLERWEKGLAYPRQVYKAKVVNVILRHTVKGN